MLVCFFFFFIIIIITSIIKSFETLVICQEFKSFPLNLMCRQVEVGQQLLDLLVLDYGSVIWGGCLSVFGCRGIYDTPRKTHISINPSSDLCVGRLIALLKHLT